MVCGELHVRIHNYNMMYMDIDGCVFAHAYTVVCHFLPVRMLLNATSGYHCSFKMQQVIHSIGAMFLSVLLQLY